MTTRGTATEPKREKKITPKAAPPEKSPENQKRSGRRLSKEAVDRLRSKLFAPPREPQRRLPHSSLFRNKKKNTDLSQVVCYNCGNKAHYASKCPEPKKPRSQLMKAYLYVG